MSAALSLLTSMVGGHLRIEKNNTLVMVQVQGVQEMVQQVVMVLLLLLVQRVVQFPLVRLVVQGLILQVQLVALFLLLQVQQGVLVLLLLEFLLILLPLVLEQLEILPLLGLVLVV